MPESRRQNDARGGIPVGWKDGLLARGTTVRGRRERSGRKDGWQQACDQPLQRSGMSLKAKLEAVIYAAEEPVTLGQLAELFSFEALAWKAEREAAEKRTAAEAAGASVAETARGLEFSAEVEAPAGQAVENVSEAAAEEAEAKEREQQRRREERMVRELLRGMLDELMEEYQADVRGIEIREVAGGYRFATKPECHDAVRQFVKSLKPALKLSLPALETLAVVAYKQPVTAPEVAEIRGVDSAGVLGSLIARKLIATAGRKQVVGRPMLYKTTKEFLLRFGLKDLSELPSMAEFEKMAAEELNEGEEVAEEPKLFVEVDGQEEPEHGAEA